MKSLENIYFIDLIRYLIFIFVISMLTISNYPALSNITIVFGLVVTSLYALYVVLQRESVQHEVIIYALWIAWSASGYFLARDMPLFLQSYFTIAQIGILIFLISGYTAKTKNLNVILYSIIISILIVITLTFIEGEVLRVLDSDAHLRLAGIVDNANSNSFAHLMLYGIFSIFLIWKRFNKVKIILTIIFLMCVAAIVLSGSRQGFFGLFTFLFFWLLFCHKDVVLKKPLLSSIIFLVIIITGYVVIDYIINETYIGQRITVGEDTDSDEIRKQMYLEGFDIIISNPIIGVGLSQYAEYSRSEMYSHSDYIEVAANTGIIGFVLYFSIYGLLWRRLRFLRTHFKEKQEEYFIGILMASILTMLVLGFTRPNVLFKLPWIYLAAVIGYSWALKKEI